MLLAVAAEARDPYTESHLNRIRGYSEAIAFELGLSPQEAREIGLASLLHDVGKMRVPDPILAKPGPLTAEEWEIIKQHPIWGDNLLSLLPSLETARQTARWHHETWDGTGYPDGLRGEEIPIGAAVTAVADSFDAMTTERPYKDAWPPTLAVKEIRAGKGRRYSPAVVEAFDRALRKGEIERVAMASPPSISDLSKAA
jgi:putative two-component system response regulator